MIYMDYLVENIRNIKVYDSSMFHMADVLEKYDQYLKKILDLEPKKFKNFILTLKNREIMNNQEEAEFDQSFLIQLYSLSQKKDSIDVTMNHINKGNITKDDIKKIHMTVIKGSADDLEENYCFRSDNEKWVGCYGTNGEQKVDYYPPKYEDIGELLDIVLDYLNDDKNNKQFETIFLKPLIVHALIAYIQPFGNGNTRLARVLQHCKICNITNKLYKTNFSRPVLYLSKNYTLTRGQYRGLIKELSVEKSDDAWNKWFKYNLNMIDEQLFFLDRQLDQYKKIK